jgi:hypothetical protein
LDRFPKCDLVHLGLSVIWQRAELALKPADRCVEFDAIGLSMQTLVVAYLDLPGLVPLVGAGDACLLDQTVSGLVRRRSGR